MPSLSELRDQRARLETQRFNARCDWDDALEQLGLPVIHESVRERIQRNRLPRTLRNVTYSVDSLPYLARQYLALHTACKQMDLEIQTLEQGDAP